MVMTISKTHNRANVIPRLNLSPQNPLVKSGFYLLDDKLPRVKSAAFYKLFKILAHIS